MSKFRLTASVVASYFKHKCDRLFRYNTVPSRLRGNPGDIGWRVPRKARQHTRPGVSLLMSGGDTFEVKQIQELIQLYGEDKVLYSKIDLIGNKIEPLPFDRFIDSLLLAPQPEYFAQIEIDFEGQNKLEPGIEKTILNHFGLNTNNIQLTKALPDLLQVVPAEDEGAPYLRIWDFKASRKPRHEHYIQVAFYSLLLEQLLQIKGISNFRIDCKTGVIKARLKSEEFDLTPYRTAVINFLKKDIPRLISTAAADAHFHVCDTCMLCEYAETCRNESDAGSDLSRIPGMSSISKRRLKQAGFTNHRQLAALHLDASRIISLRQESHDLSSNLDRYIKSAQSLEDGETRILDNKCLLMPQYEDVRLIISAEQDAVTATCFALGIKTYEGWNELDNKPLGVEEVYISSGPEMESSMLLAFLTQLNDILYKINKANTEAQMVEIPAESYVHYAEAALRDAERALAEFKLKYPRITKLKPNYTKLLEERKGLEDAIKICKARVKDSIQNVKRERRKLKKRLHIYLYDSLDLLALRECLERHILSNEPVGLLEQVKRLVRLFPPESILPDANTFRSIPGTIISQVIRQTIVLPVAYGYDLASVSNVLQPHRNTENGREKNGYIYNPKYGFGWPYSNQVAFERIHDVWEGKIFKPDPNNSTRDISGEEILNGITTTIRNKLRASDSVVRAIKEVLGTNLLLKKEHFQEYNTFDPTTSITDSSADRILEVMQVFTILEESFAEISIKHRHTLPVQERVAKFECIRGLVFISESSDIFEFVFDPECRDTKLEAGDFNLALTPESDPEQLLYEVDGQLFHPTAWQGSNAKVTLERLDAFSSPPRLWLKPNNPAGFKRKFEPSKIHSLDSMYVDYNSNRVLSTISQLRNENSSNHIHQILSGGTIDSWAPFITDVASGEEVLSKLANKERQALMNFAQWRAVSGVMRSPVNLIWGPPGTGKTYTVGHILLAYAINAKQQNLPIRILVSAFTHHAIANVLKQTIKLATKYGITASDIDVSKVSSKGNNAADDELPADCLISEADIINRLQSKSKCVIIGSTVWSVYKAMQGNSIPQQLFDVVLIDEASQMKLSDALIALSASKPSFSLILAGDDKQLPPIIHGNYVEEHKATLSSIFAFMRHRFEQSDAQNGTNLLNDSLFQLEENFRMNEPLTAYPRKVIYKRYESTVPSIRIALEPLSEDGTKDSFTDLILNPDLPVVLIRYSPPKSYTIKNPIEAYLIAQIALRLTKQLHDEEGNLYSSDGLKADGLGILSPHRAQNAAIRRALLQAGFESNSMPLIDTVEKLQGKERDVVIVSYGVADEEFAEVEASFLLSQNRFNVASTRAKRKLIVFCADAIIDTVPHDRQTLLDATMLKEFKNFCSDGEQQFTLSIPDEGVVNVFVHYKGF